MMGRDMAWMIVYREVNYRRPKSRFSFNAKPAPVPQQFPRDFVEYAAAQGAADQVPSPTKAQANALKRATKRAN